MAIFLLILSILCFASGIITSLNATTIFQQITAGISFICAAIYLIGVGIVNAIDKVHGALRTRTNPADQ